MKVPDHEIGAAICRCDNQYKLGPFAEGTRNNVMVPIRCPARCKPEGTVHTHPGGPLRLSNVDIVNLAKADLKIGCVSDGARMRCYRVSRSTV